MIFAPIVLGLIMALVPKWPAKVPQAISCIIALSMLVFGGLVTSKFLSDQNGLQLQQQLDWIPNLGVSYFVGVDSMAAWMILLTTFLTLVAILISKPANRDNQFFGLLLCLEGTLVGVFSSLDLVLFYVFFELSLVPVALMILGWGSGDRGKIAIRYIGTLFAGSLLMLVGILILGNQSFNLLKHPTFNLIEIQNAVGKGLWKDSWPLQALAFWGFMIAFLVKSPAIPIHRWLADTYENAPVGAVVAGVVLKVGTFGMFRFVLALFPEACQVYAPIMVTIGMIGILYGGILAAIQKNPGRLMAYSTVSHVGYIVVGIFSLNHIGMMGAAFQQFNHGLAAAAVFVLLGFLYERTEFRSLDDFGGLKKTMPVFSTLFMVAMLANLGLPFTSGFVGEILSLLGSFQSGYAGLFGQGLMAPILATSGAILSAVYMLYMYQRLFYGKAKSDATIGDITSREALIGGAFACLLLAFGILPSSILHSMEPRVDSIHNAVVAPVQRTAPEPSVDLTTTPAEGARGGQS